ETGPEQNTGSPKTLADFLRWARALPLAGTNGNGGPNNERSRHFLILSGHGSGTTEDFLLKDEAATDSLTVDELKSVLADLRGARGTKLEILGMDACYMAMGEIAYELRHEADILVAAEGPEPGFGWPYDRMLRSAKATREGEHHHLAPEALAS